MLEMKRLFFAVIGGAVLFAVVFPRHEKLTHSYQTSLWTYPTRGEQLTFHARPPELTFRIGGVVPGSKILHWHRLRCGLPFAAITADFQPELRILQLRAELGFVALNIGCGAPIGFAMFLIIQRRLIVRGQKHEEKRKGSVL